MEEKNQPRKKIPLWRSLLFTLLALFFVSFGPLALSIASWNYPALYSYKAAEGGVFDQENVALKDANWRSPTGEWEFYYNRWILTDQDPNPRDGLITYGQSWSSLGFPLKGYASYKLNIINAVPGEKWTIEETAVYASANFYLNGVLVAHSGAPDKDPAKSIIAGDVQIDGGFLVPASGSLSLVCEMGYSDCGGIGFKPGFTYVRNNLEAIAEGWIPHNVFANSIPSIAQALILLMIGATFTLLLVSKGKGLSASFAYLLVTIFLYDMVSADEGFFFERNRFLVNSLLIERINPSVAAFVLAALFYYLFKMGSIPFLKKKDFLKVFLPFLGLALGLGIATGLTLGLPASVYLMMGQWLLAIPLVLLALYSVIQGQKKSFAPFVIACFLLNFLISEWLDIQELICWDIWGVPSIALCLIGLVGTIVFIRRDLALRKSIAEKEELALRYEKSKEEALKGQIKPHFIFNCLSAIEASYHKNIDEGDHAMNLFAQHLRSDVDSLDKSLVPFEEEIKNVDHYVELENLRLPTPYVLLYDIERTDFLVPPLSLQPFIENAIKYSKANEKENGFLSLRVHTLPDGAIGLFIEDNGVGFDVKSIGEKSQGLKNASERFALILGASVLITSEIGQGTTITITIPPKAGATPFVSSRQS